MYLTENTPEAQEMRQKVRDMLVSEYEPNVGLAFAILQTGGFHLELFPYIWSAYCSKKYDLQEYEDTFQAMIVALFPEKLHEYIQHEASRMRAYYWRSPYNLFNNTTFFELLVSENMTTLSALLGYWEREPFYKKHTCLTRFLLENKATIDKGFFLHPDLPAHFLRTQGLDYLFQDEDENFDKLAFLKRYILPKTPQRPFFTLDLSNTGLTVLPKEVLALEGLEVLNIYGTKIRDLPHEVLATVKQLYVNKKTKRKIYGKIMGEGRFDYFYAQFLAYQKANTLWEGKKYTESVGYFEIAERIIHTVYFSEKEQNDFWERYFYALFREGKLNEAKDVLQKAAAALPYPRLFDWNGWLTYMAHFYCLEIEKEYLDILEKYATESNAMRHLGLAHIPENIGYVHDYGWRVMHEVAIYKGQIQGAIRIVAKACAEIPTIQLPHWHWLKYFRHLHFKGDFESIVLLFEKYETMFLFQADGSLATERLHRVVWIWIEAYIRVGKLERAELLCSYHIQYFQKHQSMPSTYFARLAYHYLGEIYTAQGKTACAEWGRQVLEDIHTLLQPKVFL